MKKELIVILCIAIGNCTTTKNSFNLSFGAGFKKNEKYIVGYFPVKEDFNPIEYSDINEACTAFIKREIEEIRTS